MATTDRERGYAPFCLQFPYIAHHLHSNCCRGGNCDPEEVIEELVPGVTKYIGDARA